MSRASFPILRGGQKRKYDLQDFREKIADAERILDFGVRRARSALGFSDCALTVPTSTAVFNVRTRRVSEGCAFDLADASG
jgi:hypothetical protein